MPQKTINNVWAELSINRSTFTEEEIGSGIVYKGNVVSNQLNGVVYNIYDMLDFIQRSGGLYNSTKKYFNGDFVSVVRNGNTGPVRVEQYRCITTNENGIEDNPPILNAVYDEDDRIPIFQGGYANLEEWIRCDVVGAGEVDQTRLFKTSDKVVDIPTQPSESAEATTETADATTTEGDNEATMPTYQAPETAAYIKVFSLGDVVELDHSSETFSSSFNMTIYLDDKVTSFTCILQGVFTKTLDDNIVLLPNRIGSTTPEIIFKDVRSNVEDFGEENDFHSLMPFGVRFEYSGNSADQNIYMRVRKGVKKIVLTGYSTYINPQLNNDAEPLENYIVIPVRSNGGLENFEEIGNIVSKDFTLPVAMQYKMGLYKLNTESTGWEKTEDNENKDSPFWGKDKNATSPLFGMLHKVRGTYNVPPYQGVFLRNLGEEKISGLVDVPIRGIANFQGDAIRKSPDGIAGGGTFEGGRGNLSGGFSSLGNAGSYALNNGSFTSSFLKIGFSFAAALNMPTSHDIHPSNISVQFYYRAF